jgi:hypothetical protein
VRRPCYLVVRQPDGHLAVHLEERRGHLGPLHFVIENRLVYRTESHPDGQSSIPYLRMTRLGRLVMPAEGFPTGASDAAVFEAERFRKTKPGVRVSPNPHRAADREPPTDDSPC